MGIVQAFLTNVFIKLGTLFSPIVLALFFCVVPAETFASPASITEIKTLFPKYLLFAIPVKFNKLDPKLSLSAHARLTLPLIYEPLVYIRSDQELKPQLAQSWHVSKDLRSITLTIRKGEHFSNGTEVTSKDVVTSFFRLCSPGSEVADHFEGIVGCVDHAHGASVLPDIRTLSKYKIEFSIDISPTSFLYELASANAVIVKIVKSSLIGSGPYQIAAQKTNYLALKPNRFYTRKTKVKNRGMVLVSIGDQKIEAALDQGRLDGAIMYKYNSIYAAKNSIYRMILTNPNISELLVLNSQRFPFNHKILRQAIASQVYNNSNIIKCAAGARKAYGLIPNGLGGSIDNMPPTSLPVITPKQVFKQLPTLEKKSIAITVHQLAAEKNTCEAKNLEAIGKLYHIDMVFKYHKSYATLWPLYLNHQLSAFVDSYVFMNREASSVLRFFTKAGENDANLSDSYADDLLNEAVSSPSPVTRFTYYRTFAQYFEKNAFVVPLFYMKHGDLIKKCIIGVPTNFYYNPFQYLIQLHKPISCSASGAKAKPTEQQ